MPKGDRAEDEVKEGTWGQILQGLVGHSEDFALTLGEVEARGGLCAENRREQI